MTNKQQTKKQAVVEQPNVLSKHDHAALAAAKTTTKNDGSHIAKQRAARLAQITTTTKTTSTKENK